jgi:arrestin-related trafficking adapter 1
MNGSLALINYVLLATVQLKTGESIKLSQILDVKRSIPKSDTPHRSIRIFPPTNVIANCELPLIIYPIGEANFTLHMDGVVKHNPDMKTQTQWKLKRLGWCLEEIQKVISPGCTKHAANLGDIEDSKKGIAHQDVRTIGEDKIMCGWKADYTNADGSIELEFPFGVQAGSNPTCNLNAEDGI